MTRTTSGAVGRTELRTRMRRGMEPVAALFGKVGLSPNALTLIGFGIALLAGGAAMQQQWLVAGLLVILGAVFDLFDGALARATGRTSKLGAFLDSTFDRAGEAIVYFGIIVGLGEAGYVGGPGFAAAAMVAAFMVSYTRAKSESLGFAPGSGMASVGLAPREVRVVILTLGLVGAGLLSTPPPEGPGADGGALPLSWIVLVGSLLLITLLATITTIQRIAHVVREARDTETP